MLKNLTRRTFLKFLSTPLVITLFGCSRSPKVVQSLDNAIKEEAFAYFLEVIFPAKTLGFQGYEMQLLEKLEKLTGEHAQIVARCYHFFKEKYVDEFDSFDAHTLQKGESILVQLLEGKQADETNRALDIIYVEISKIKGLQEDLWNREFSTAHKMCAYWDNYDEAVKL